MTKIRLEKAPWSDYDNRISFWNLSMGNKMVSRTYASIRGGLEDLTVGYEVQIIDPELATKVEMRPGSSTIDPCSPYQGRLIDDNELENLFGKLGFKAGDIIMEIQEKLVKYARNYKEKVKIK